MPCISANLMSFHMRKLIFSIFSSILALFFIPGASFSSINAQSAPENMFSVTGTVEDAEKNPVYYATVSISLSATPNRVYKAMASNDRGKFTLELPKGKYIFKFRSVGYKEGVRNIELDSLGVDLGTIVLQENTTELQEIVVRPLVEYNAREIVYNITADPDREKSGMLDIVSKVPFLSVIDDKIVAENDPNKSIIILRNGKKDPLFSGGGVSYNEVMRNSGNGIYRNSDFIGKTGAI